MVGIVGGGLAVPSAASPLRGCRPRKGVGVHEPTSRWRLPIMGIGISVLIVILGALNLTLDFAFIEKAAAAGAPRFMQWYGAFGLMLSLIWIYVSVLRLLALLRARQ